MGTGQTRMKTAERGPRRGVPQEGGPPGGGALDPPRGLCFPRPPAAEARRRGAGFLNGVSVSYYHLNRGLGARPVGGGQEEGLIARPPSLLPQDGKIGW